MAYSLTDMNVFQARWNMAQTPGPFDRAKGITHYVGPFDNNACAEQFAAFWNHKSDTVGTVAA